MARRNINTKTNYKTGIHCESKKVHHQDYNFTKYSPIFTILSLMCFRCDLITGNFIANFLDSLSEKVLKIGQYLVKLWQKLRHVVFWLVMYIYQ